MAKGRLIPTMLNQSSRWGRLEEFDRYLFTYIIVHADDQGRMHAAPAFVKSKALPWNSASVQEVSGALTRLEQEGYIFLYEHDRNELLQIVDWWEMQSLSWAQPSQLPSPDGWVDRIRYQNGGKILKRNWQMCGGFSQDFPEHADNADEEVEGDRGIPEENNPLGSHLSSDLPSPLDNSQANPLSNPLPGDLISPQGSDLGSSQGNSLGSPQGSGLGNTQDSSLGSSQGSSQGSSLGSPLGSGINQIKLNKIKPKKIKKTTTSKKVNVSTKSSPPGEKPPDGATDFVAVVADDLPESVIDQLALLGWADGYGEIKRVYGQDPDLVTAWIEHTLASDLPDGQAAGYFRNRLREGEMPPKIMSKDEKRATKFRAAKTKYRLSGNDDEGEQPLTGGNGKIPFSPPDIPEKHQTAWQSALGELQLEMPKAAFDAWVKNTVLVATEEDTFTLATGNDNARDWLEDRLTAPATRLLTEIMGRNIRVQFEVWERTIDHNGYTKSLRGEGVTDDDWKCWQSALEQLRLDMSKPSFDEWVSGVALISTEEDTFTLATGNEYTRDWLEDRLRSTFTRLLTGARGHQTQVEIVVRE